LFDKSNILLDNNANYATNHSNSLISDFSSKLATVDGGNTSQTTTLVTSLNYLSVKFETLRKLKVSVLSQIQLTMFLYA
jgi:hypothetical protein